MKIDCKHVWQHISDYLDKTLDRETLAAVERHLENCEICSAVLDSTRNIVMLSGDERVFELPISFSERLHDRLQKEFDGERQV